MCILQKNLSTCSPVFNNLVKFFLYLINFDRKANLHQQYIFFLKEMFFFQTNNKSYIKGVRKERLSKYLNHQIIVCEVKAVV